MRSLRDRKRKGRRRLHDRLQVPALYIASTGARPLPVSVRLHTKFEALGNQHGINAAEREDVEPSIVFLRSELAPQRGAIVSVETGEAYRVAVVLPPDDITVTARVVRLTPTEAADLPVPEIC